MTGAAGFALRNLSGSAAREPGTVEILVQSFGTALALGILADIFLTVLYVRGGAAWLSPQINLAVWAGFRAAARLFPSASGRLLSFCGPALLALVPSVWVVLLVMGFALIFWPELGRSVCAAEGPTDTSFATAVYFSGLSLTTLGTGDIVPVTGPARLLMVIESALGFSVLTLSLTYFLSVYGAVERRNAFALDLHHRSAETGDAAELVARWGATGRFDGVEAELSAMAGRVFDLLESHHSHTVLHYFRFPEPHLTAPRVLLLAADAASLLRSVPDPAVHRRLLRSGGLAALWGGTLQMLADLSRSGPTPSPSSTPADAEVAWVRRYAAARNRLAAEGVAVIPDEAAGAEAYARCRREWDAALRGLAAHIGEKWSDIDRAAGPSAPQ